MQTEMCLGLLVPLPSPHSFRGLIPQQTWVGHVQCARQCVGCRERDVLSSFRQEREDKQVKPRAETDCEG